MFVTCSNFKRSIILTYVPKNILPNHNMPLPVLYRVRIWQPVTKCLIVSIYRLQVLHIGSAIVCYDVSTWADIRNTSVSPFFSLVSLLRTPVQLLLSAVWGVLRYSVFLLFFNCKSFVFYRAVFFHFGCIISLAIYLYIYQWLAIMK